MFYELSHLRAADPPDPQVRQTRRMSGERTLKVLRWLGWGFVTLVGLYVLWYVADLVYWNFTGENLGLCRSNALNSA